MPVKKGKGKKYSGTLFACPVHLGGCGCTTTKVARNFNMDDSNNVGRDIKFRTRTCPKCGLEFTTEERVYMVIPPKK